MTAAVPRWRRTADLVVVGSGAAGIATALTAAAAGLRVLMVTKDLVGGATALAQGGLAAAIGPRDSAASHVGDTLVAGAGLCEPEVVAALAAGAPAAIDWLAKLGARLDTRELRLEGGHSHRRIVHSGDDATGAEVHRVLLAAVLASGVEILDRTVALDLSTAEPDANPDAGRVTGLVAGVIGPGGRLTAGVIHAPAAVIAAGGLGQAFATTSNPAGATGDGIAIAARAGAVLRDLEFVQFHPTVLWLPGASGQCPLITEALRGAGAVLRDLDGKPLMAGQDPRGDLAPRDVVAARMAEVIGTGGGHVWLDATGIDAGFLEAGFPTVLAACRKHGIDPLTEFIPVAPGAHYSCGGILADLDGQTSIPGLYAVGEAASTGVQGANRLASNSVTEAIIAGRRAGQAIAVEAASRAAGWHGGLTGGDENTVGGAETAAGHDIAGTDGNTSPLNSGNLGDGRPTPASAVSGAPDGQYRGDRRAALASVVSGAPDSPDGGDGRPALASIVSSAPDGQYGGDRRPALASIVSGAPDGPDGGDGGDGRRALALAMSRWAGVLRDRAGLAELARMISAAERAVGAGRACATESGAGAGSGEAGCVPSPGLDLGLDLAAVEAANLRVVSGLIAAGALRRAESRGCHRRRDAPVTAERPWHTLARWDGQEFTVNEEEL